MDSEDTQRYEQFWTKLKVGMNTDARVATNEMSSNSFVNKILPQKLKEHNLSYNEFNDLRLTPEHMLTETERIVIQNIRDSVPRPDVNTTLIKNFHESDIKKYLNGDYDSVKGFVAKADDSAHIHNYSHVRESMRLDYSYYDGFKDEIVTPYPEHGKSYGYIKFKVEDPVMLSRDQLEIPYGKNMAEPFKGREESEWPWTGNGFTSARNKEVIPEWRFNNFVNFKKGAELHEVVDGNDTIIGIFDGEEFREIIK